MKLRNKYNIFLSVLSGTRGQSEIPEHLYPGVYVEEIEVGGKPIEGVSTSTAGMVGMTQTGPLNEPTLITSFRGFSRKFGGHLDQSYGEHRYLPYAVEGFFWNGGQRVYVTRVGVTDVGQSITDETIIGVDDSDPSKRTGLQTLKNIDQISIVAIPNGTSQNVQNAMISHCELMKDRFAVLDPAKNADLRQIRQQRSQYDSKYAALYYPWINVKNPFTEDVLPVPPSGHIRGIYARTDMEHGVHKAPANEMVQGALSLERKITKKEQDILNPLGVNCLRVFEDRGIRVWGARTISSDPLWKYVNVRRLVLYLEQ
ncbi:MAG: phage tail sheath subtilisin-like domain-containing protein, partial [Candidatus Bathyarchaeota archaeon]|nr:phage tail sheath subtilisin-like domain-containing protein [Candidatus Bathyarchaeota archaeon]